MELRFDYKVLLYTYKAFNNHALPSISELITKYESRRALRLSSKCVVVAPIIQTKGYARSFSYATTVLWNALCDDGLTGSDSVAE